MKSIRIFANLLMITLLMLTFGFLFGQNETDIQTGFDFNRIDIPDEEYHQELLIQKTDLEVLYNSNDSKKVVKQFKRESKLFNKHLKKSELEEASFKLYEIETKFSDIGEFHDDILFLNVLLADRQKSYPSIEKYSLLLLNNFFNSDFVYDTVYYLGKVYFLNHNDSALIDLFAEYSNVNNDEINFWLANAYYNEGELSLSKKSLSNSFHDKDIALKAASLEGLIIYSVQGNEAAVNWFLELEENYKAKYHTYSFVLLTLARLYYEGKDYSNSALYYDSYYNLKKDDTPAEILYEMSNFSKEIDDSSKQKLFLNQIIKQHNNTVWYAKANQELALLNQKEGAFEQAKLRLEDQIETNKLIEETIISKRELYDKYNNLITEASNQIFLVDTISTNLKHNIISTEIAIERTTAILSDLYTGYEPQNIVRINELEQEFFPNVATKFEILKLFNKDNSHFNKKIDSYIDYQVSLIDSSLLSLQVIKYLMPVSIVTQYDYELASLLAAERFYEIELINDWIDTKNIAEQNNRSKFIEHADKMIENLQLNIESLDKIAEIKFGKLDDPEAYKFINEEEIALINDKEEYLNLKLNYKDNFNRKIKNKLMQQNADLDEVIVAFNKDLDYYLNAFENDTIASRKKYEVDLLNVLFNESKTLDMEYNEMQNVLLRNVENE